MTAILTMNGTAMPAPSALAVSLEDVCDDAGRNALGERVVDRVAVKRVISLSWARLTTAQLSALLQAATGEVFFTAVYPDPLTGMARETVCRATEKSCAVYRADGASPEWAEIAMKWEER